MVGADGRLVFCNLLPQEYVVDIVDGDTVSIVVNRELTQVRIDGIVCPELNQRFGDEAKQFTTDFCMKQNVELVGDETDANGGRLADVMVKGQSLREALLSAGLAWHDTQTKNELAKLQAKARAAKRGLWADDDPVPPGEWEE